MNLLRKIADKLEKLCIESTDNFWRSCFKLVVKSFLSAFKFVQITVREFFEDRLILRAMALTFATLLSIIPLLALVFSIFKYFGGGEWFMEMVRPVLERSLAPGSGNLVVQRIETILETSSGTMVSGIGLLFLVLVVYGIFSAIESTFNLIWGVRSRAGALNRIPLYWGLVTIIPTLLVMSLTLTTYLRALPMVSRAVERMDFADTLISHVLPVFIVMLSFFLLYRFLPATRVKTVAAIGGAIIAGLLYELVKMVFIVYTGKLVNYDIFYGSLATIPLLMVWINLSWVVVLLGVEVCFVLQHYKALLNKRKHVEFSRIQKDALAYLLLAQVTLAFRGKRKPVTIEEWIGKYAIPPNVVLSVVERLRIGKIVERTGSRGNGILLVRDPDFIRIRDIDRILSGESQEEWTWPDYEPWQWLRGWMRLRCDSTSEKMSRITLGELVTKLENVENGCDSVIADAMAKLS